MARFGVATSRQAWLGMDRHGTAGHGKAWLGNHMAGVARQGLAGRGTAWQPHGDLSKSIKGSTIFRYE